MQLEHTPPVSLQPEVEVAECLILTAPHCFERRDFLDWRQGYAEGQGCAPACWLPDQRTGEFTDVFVTFDRSGESRPPPLEPGYEHLWEGSDVDTMPADIVEEISRILHEHDLYSGVIQIKPI